jgi:opacity protein-like surface antigen
MKSRSFAYLAAALLSIGVSAVPAFPLSNKTSKAATAPNVVPVVRSIKPETQNGTLRIVINTNVPAEFTDFSLDNPPRIVVDFAGFRNEFGAKTIQLYGMPVHRVRVGEPQPGTVRVVLDSLQAVKYTVIREGNSVVVTVPAVAGPAPGETISDTPSGPPDPGKQKVERPHGYGGIAPRVEIYGGYQFTRVDFPFLGDHNANGFTTSVSTNMNKYLGVTADFSASWGSPSFSDFNVGLDAPGSLHYNSYSLMAGPRLTLREDRLTVFGHALVGFAHVSYDKASLNNFLGAFGLQANNFSSNSFAGAFGGGIDIRLSRSVSLRALQADYLLTNFADFVDGQRRNRNNVRVSTGIVFRLGDVR